MRCAKAPQLALAGAFAAAVLSSCDSQNVTQPPVAGGPAFVIVPTLEAGKFKLCKDGTTATFDFSVNGGAASQVTLADDQCQTIHTFSGQPFDEVSVTENVPAGFVLDSIIFKHFVSPTQGSPPVPTTDKITGTNTISDAPVGLESGAVAVFYNSPIGGGEGCTPGFWKAPQHFGVWPSPYTPGTLFDDVNFENAFPGLTLLQVLQQGGGGLNALGRHTVAALLNAASPNVDYDLTVAQVIAQFNAVFPGTLAAYEALKDDFEDFNQQGTPGFCE